MMIGRAIPARPNSTADGLRPGRPVRGGHGPDSCPRCLHGQCRRVKARTSGIALFEAYDLTAEADASLANISTRGAIGTGDDVLISGFIVGDVNNATVVVRAIGLPSRLSA